MEFPNINNLDYLNQADADAMQILKPLYYSDLNFQIDADRLGRPFEDVKIKSLALVAIQNLIRLKIIEWKSTLFVSPYTTLSQVKEDFDYNILKDQLGQIGYDLDAVWSAYDMDTFITTTII